jgi:two-component system nitrate/nitrite response regulator NarL
MNNNQNKIKLILVDDQTLFAEGLSQLLQHEADIEVLEILYNGAHLVPLLSSIPCNLILLDIDLPFPDGLHLCPKIRKEFPEIRVAFLSVHDDSRTISKAEKAGASAFFSKYQAASNLIKAIREIMQRPPYTFGAFTELNGGNNSPSMLFVNMDLTQREREILEAIINGLEPKEICDKYFISYDTFKTHRNNIFRKYSVRNEIELARKVYNLNS